MTQNGTSVKRETVFISKATPGDDEFVLWIAPRLEAAGYTVFADILSLEPGDRWRKQVTGTLQDKAIKMLLCCRDSTLAKDGVQEEIAIAEDLATELNNPRFIIPLRIEKFKKVFGIGGLQYVDFVGSWANGLRLSRRTREQLVAIAKESDFAEGRSCIATYKGWGGETRGREFPWNMGCAYALVPNKYRKAVLVKYPGCRSLDELGSVLDTNN